MANLISLSLCREALLTSAVLINPALIFLFFVFVMFFSSSVSSLFWFPLRWSEGHPFVQAMWYGRPQAINCGAAKTRYGDRRFNAKHVQHYRWAFTVVRHRAPTVHKLLSLFNLEDCRQRAMAVVSLLWQTKIEYPVANTHRNIHFHHLFSLSPPALLAFMITLCSKSRIHSEQMVRISILDRKIRLQS